jgi:hypothetical protein
MVVCDDGVDVRRARRAARGMIGSRVASRYVIEEVLASGGMGVVCRVRDRSTGDQVALKRLAPEAARRGELVEAFEREYQVLAGLDHPRIIRVFDYGVDTDGPYYTMELLAGLDMRKAAPLPYRDACRYLRDVATSLALLHTRHLLHRDLSPGNVRTTDDKHCKLIDFGALAAFGASHLVVGTPPVVPPEALAGAPLDQRSDLYALGSLAYWMLTGRHAYPARRFEELPIVWKRAPTAPSSRVAGIPPGVDELVLSLLSADPRLRPSSAAEVISRLNLLAHLEPEGADDVARLAESFLLSPRFVGRAATLDQVDESVEALMVGRGDAVRIAGAAGTGRSRLLEEIGLRAQVAGAGVVRVDASVVRDRSGTARALVLGVLDALPQLSRENVAAHLAALATLGGDVVAKLTHRESFPPGADEPPASRSAEEERSSRAFGPGSGGSVEGWILQISRAKPLVLEIDNVDDADDDSLGLLVALARAAAHSPLLIVVTETTRLEPRDAPGLVTLRGQCEHLVLEGMSAAETLELCRSLFGDAPNVERFAEWLHGRTAGSPLHCIEISRRLLSDRVLRYIDGMWSLPADRPNADLPEDLEDALLARLALLSEPARGVAESLCLARGQPTMALLRLLLDDPNERYLLQVLDELARSDVLHADRGGYRFGSTALREALLADMDRARRAGTHRRLGAALARVAGPGNPELRIEAGWHLIKGGDDLRGADMIAKVTHDSATIQKMLHVNVHHVGRPLEAALHVYRRYRRSTYERAPLLAALAHASYPEGRVWAERYGDEALDACEDLSGVRTARALRRFLGRWPSMIVGILFAFVRFHLTPRRERDYAFRELFVRLFGAVTALTATAAVLLDVERATRIVETIELFSALPERFAPAGIYKFCVGMPEIGRERQTQTYRSFETLLRRFEEPGYYRELPEDARILYVTGAHFVRGVFATMRADGRPALASADALEASGLRMYAMVACQLRFLYHTYRGELAEAAVHREKAEVHAAHLGSGWQVDTWEPAALIPVASKLRDVVALTRIADRLEQSSESVPSLDLYKQLAHLALWRARGGYAGIESFALVLESREPRGFIGWAQSIAVIARAANEVGDHAQAKALCESGLVHITDDDREFVALFLDLDIEMANSLAGIGEADAGLARIDRLLERFDACDHPLVKGSLHEARARIAWNAGRVAEYVHSLAVVERWFRPTGTSGLIAKIERLAALQTAPSGPPFPSSGEARAAEPSATGAVPRLSQERARRLRERDATTAVAPVKRRETP